MKRFKEAEIESNQDAGKHYGRSIICLIISAALNLMVLGLVFKYTTVFYETNDDYGISDMLAKGYPHIGFVNYYLCKILVTIQKSVPNVNIFVISQIVMSFLAMTFFLKIVIERRKSIGEVLMALSALAIISFDHYSCIQFTKTAALLMACGLILLTDTYIHERRIVSFAFATALYFTGVCYRQKGMIPSLAYVGVFMLLWWLINHREFAERTKSWVKEIALVLSIIIILLIPFGLDYLSDQANGSTEVLKRARDYHIERVKITDYPVYDYYEDNKDKYEEIGISDNDLHLIDRWIFDYDGAASYENLKKINEINKDIVESNQSIDLASETLKEKTLKNIEKKNFSGIHMYMAIMLLAYVVLVTRPRNWMYVLAFAGVSYACYLALYYMQRVQYRALYVEDVNVILWLIYTALISKKWEYKGERISREVLSLVVACGMLTLINPALKDLNEDVDYIGKTIESEELADYFDSNQDKMFIGASTVMEFDKSYLDPLHLPDPERNVADTGGWETLSPYKLDQLSKYGIANPVRDIINHDNVYYYSDYYRKKLTEYLNKWYGDEYGTIRFVKVDEADGETVYKVVADKENEY